MKLLIIWFLFVGVYTNAQSLGENAVNRKSLLNFAMLLKNKESKSEDEIVKLAETYEKLGYKYLAAEKYIELGKKIRNAEKQRKYLSLADSLNKLPYKRLYAKSFLYQETPDLIVEQWLSEQPDIEGKFVLVDFWATWCGPCKKAIPELNEIHNAYKDKLIVVGISDEQAEKVNRFTYPPIEYYKAIDTQKRMFSQLQISGIPHVIVISPEKKVIWEGFPFDHKDPLTKDKIDELIKLFE